MKEYLMAINKTKNNKYCVDAWNIYGKRIRKVFDRRQEAQAFEANIETDKYQHKLVNAALQKKRYPIENAFNDFEASKSMLRPKSIERYKNSINAIRGFARGMNINYLDEFTSDMATIFFNELVREREINKGNHKVRLKAAPKTINFYLTVFKSFFNQEVIKGHLDRSPALHIKNVKVENKKPEYYSIEELDAFFNQDIPEPYRNFFLGLLYTGLRYGEAANLTWDDIDFKRKLVHINEKENHSLKTSNSVRSIPMNKLLFDLLSNMFEKRTSDLVFVNSHNNSIKERRALSVCKKTAEKAGIKKRAYLHKFRSTFATLLVRNNVSLESIKELLGHSSLVETEKAYANNESTYLHSEVSVLDNVLKQKQSE